MLKKCSSCKTDKHPSEFNKNKTKADGLSNQCRKCSNARSHRHYIENKAQRIADTASRKPAQRKKCYDYIISLNPKCRHCGEDDLCCIDWHHVDPTQKDGDISKLAWDGYIRKLITEIAKCIPLCSNCHRKEHYRLKVLLGGLEPPQRNGLKAVGSTN